MIGDIQTFLKLFDVHEISVTFLDTYVFEYCATLYETWNEVFHSEKTNVTVYYIDIINK